MLAPTPTQSTMMNVRQLHWKVPTIMLCSLLAGIILSVGHHLFYASLDGSIVTSLSQQTMNIRIGTGFAFLIKLSLTAAVSIACVQNLWHVFRQRPIRLGTIDGLFSILAQPLVFMDLQAWRCAPLVVALAAIAWSIPLAAVVTPATLTVELSGLPSKVSQLMQVPTVDWYNTTNMCYMGGGPGYFNGAKSDITRIALAVGTSASILPIKNPPAPNATYTVQFEGPSLKCRNANETVQTLVRQLRSGDSFYNAWAGSRNLTESFYDAANICDSSPCTPSTYDGFDDEMMKLYFIAGVSNTTVLECGFYNSTFVVDFEFSNGAQTTSVRNETIRNPHPFLTVNSPSPVNPWADPVTRRLYLQSYVYQAVADAFGKLLIGMGRITSPSPLAHAHQTMRTTFTQVLFTPLVNMQELENFRVMDGSMRDIGGLGRNFSLKEGVEEIFLNLTLSLFSVNQYLLPPEATDPVAVTVLSPQNSYRYSPRNLCLAYGLAIFFAALAVILGVTLMAANGAAFANDFSTVLRVSRNPELMEIVRSEDTKGAQPLPQRLKKVMLGLQSLDGVEGRYDSMMVDGRIVRKETLRDSQEQESEELNARSD